MKLSVTVVNYKQKYFPRICIEALEKSKTNFDFEIIFCDNDSADESLEFLKQAHKEGRIKLTEPGKNLGYGSGHNFAARQASGQYILILNTDITVQEDTLQKLVDFMDADSAGKIGMVGPKLMYHNGYIQRSCRRDFNFFDLLIKRTFLKKIGPFKKRYEQYMMEDYTHDTTQKVDLITGAFMLMPKAIFDEVGGFDERYFLFMEDFDLCRKVRQKGYEVIYYPQSIAVHYHKRLSEGTWFKLIFRKVSWYHLASAIKYHWKWRRSV